MDGPIDMEQKRCELISSHIRYMALAFDLTHDLDLNFYIHKLYWNLKG